MKYLVLLKLRPETLDVAVVVAPIVFATHWHSDLMVATFTPLRCLLQPLFESFPIWQTP